MPLAWPLLALFSMVDGPMPLDGWTHARSVAAKSTLRIVDSEGRVGTGVIVGTRGTFVFALTAAHVVEKPENLRASFGESKRPIRDVEVIKVSRERDLAVVRLECDEPKVAPALLAEPSDDSATEDFAAISIGCDEAKPTDRVERILGKKLLKRSDGSTVFAWETKEASKPGRSGGALLDSSGRVLGICSGTQDGKGYFIHGDEISAWLRKAGLAWLGRAESKR